MTKQSKMPGYLGAFLLVLLLLSSCQRHEPATNSSRDLLIEDIRMGKGANVKRGQTLRVHYVGKYKDGRKFDSSRDRNQPFKFALGLGEVMAGWDQGIVGMKVGGKRRLTIPPSLTFDKEDSNGVIASGKTLIYEIEILDIL